MPLTTDQKAEAYRRMYTVRQFENAGVQNIKRGNIAGVCHSSIGQEASSVGACMALAPDDYLIGTHRSHGHLIGKGANINRLMAELMGKETGVCKGRGGEMHIADASVGALSTSGIVGGGIPLALGAALSAFVKGDGKVALGFFGDGASNQGVFYESMNMAAVWGLPMIFLCENNSVAAVTSAENTHAERDIAKRAEAHGIPNIIVDGQDVEAVFDATSEAVARARGGEGPSLVETKTHRFDSHAAGLFFGDHRSEEEMRRVKEEQDPVVNLRQALKDSGLDEGKIADIEAGVDAAIKEAVEFGLSSPYPDAERYSDYMFATPVRANYQDLR
ncbi:MAG: thiamine pyrophosphate-dependent dehydrogenase E1 component subunit alpha [Pseudomonadota bacterium]